jgi:hypothetical protein
MVNFALQVNSQFLNTTNSPPFGGVSKIQKEFLTGVVKKVKTESSII